MQFFKAVILQGKDQTVWRDGIATARRTTWMDWLFQRRILVHDQYRLFDAVPRGTEVLCYARPSDGRNFIIQARIS